MTHGALLTSTCMVHHRSDTTDANGDIVTTEVVTGPHPCHAYQYFATEKTERNAAGYEDMVVHLPPGVSVTNYDRLDIVWPNGRTLTVEATGPPAERVNARLGEVHHVEVRCREVQ